MKAKTTAQRRKPYRPPRLVVYGDLRRLTMTKGGNKGDGGGKPTTRASGAAA
ncbi:MAG: lasso RiPP family leader peptide-containing protein [Candidatus Rokubacteria bacterium]|nr:lasso RiPP family leader peptide-containing protein [Candidatus Rokubacteria bacterium]